MSKKKSPGEASRRVMMSIPQKDVSVIAWLDAQENVSASMRHYLRTVIIPKHGLDDPLTKQVELDGSGAPTKAEKNRRREAARRFEAAGVDPAVIESILGEDAAASSDGVLDESWTLEPPSTAPVEPPPEGSVSTGAIDEEQPAQAPDPIAETTAASSSPRRGLSIPRARAGSEAPAAQDSDDELRRAGLM